MTKWFDTNYHYLVPEFDADTEFSPHPEALHAQFEQARRSSIPARPVLLGPLSYLYLGKGDPAGLDRLALLPRLLPVYAEILAGLARRGATWVLMDEPCLALDWPEDWLTAFEAAYRMLARGPLKVFLASYFGNIARYARRLARLPLAGLHLDLVRAPGQLEAFLDDWPQERALSLGVIDGRNVWRADLRALLARLRPVHDRLGDRLWLAPSCSLLHVPVDLDRESGLDPEVRPWMAFAVQKLDELRALKTALDAGEAAAGEMLAASDRAAEARACSARVRRLEVRSRLAALGPGDERRASPYAERRARQGARLRLPAFPTTTIGSFPQTDAIRRARAAFKAGTLTADDYAERMRAEIRQAVALQEALGLDVLVHGEAERGDMVEYFAERLDGFAITAHGWVQSYGSRCVKPPLIVGDVHRPAPMTVDWARYAQSLTDRPVKGMLTGPVTLLQWSFARDDQPRAQTALQLALAVRDEARDLEAAGLGVIQIDEPALREALPLARADWDATLAWATRAFRVAASGVRDDTQIHTHMCYAEFNDILPAIAALDADVITVETSRSRMELLRGFAAFHYPNDIGPGVYDIHSPRVPTTAEMVALLEAAAAVIPSARLWVNPDCGLKTRTWPEVEAALARMVEAARCLRRRIAAGGGESGDGRA